MGHSTDRMMLFSSMEASTTRMRGSTTIFLLLLLSATSGCGEFRGIPTHGGGKRFDEEQRVVASAIRQSIADMDLEVLKGRRVQLTVDGLAQDGGGSVYFPGLNSVSAGISGNIGTGNLVQINQALAAGPRLTNDNYNNNVGGNIGASYSPQTNYATHGMSSAADLQYLRATIEMKAVHAGLMLVAADPEIVLHVLVDVLGTNRSRTDLFVSNSETLEASCEATYYAQNARTGELVFEARRVSSESTYRETRAFGMKSPIIDRIIERTHPTPLPVHATPAPCTQPTVSVPRKGWFESMLTKITAE
jgi:hypothetical protein